MDQSHPGSCWRPPETGGGDDGLISRPHGHGGLPDQTQTQSGTDTFSLCYASTICDTHKFSSFFLSPYSNLIFLSNLPLVVFLIFLPLSHLLYHTSSVGGLAPDSISTTPHMCHDIKVQGHGIGCPPHNHFQHSAQSWCQRLTETQPHIGQTNRRVEIAFWVKWCLKCFSVVVSGIMCPG